MGLIKKHTKNNIAIQRIEAMRTGNVWHRPCFFWGFSTQKTRTVDDFIDILKMQHNLNDGLRRNFENEK